MTIGEHNLEASGVRETADMDAKELLDAGRLTAAIEQLNQDVRAHPADPRLRTFLFEMLCFAGDYQRAERQLDALTGFNSQIESGTLVYRDALAAERSRMAVNNENQLPTFLLEPPKFASSYLAAVHQLREGNIAEARTLLLKGIDDHPPTPGKIDGQAFAEFGDADPFLAPFLEIIVNRRYVWVPFVHIKRFAIVPPRRLRDLLWAEATLETIGGPSGSVLLPVLYSGSFRHPDEQVRLGRVTEWQDVGEKLVRGCGQRIFIVDDSEKPMLQCRQVEFDPAT
jgi:type VI secretion system protein ImpE